MEFSLIIKVYGRNFGSLLAFALFQRQLADVPNNILQRCYFRDLDYNRYYLCLLLIQNRELLCDLAAPCAKVCLHSGYNYIVFTCAGYFYLYAELCPW